MKADRLAEAVSNALAAATEGGEHTEAPEPSDEPGSPYVMHITASLRAAGVVVLTEERLAAAIRTNWYEIRPHGGEWLRPAAAASAILRAIGEDTEGTT